MRIINSSNKFSVGSRVIVTKEFKSGMILLCVGAIGKIIGDHFETLPDIGLFNIRVVEIDFGQHKISVGESVAKQHMRTL